MADNRPRACSHCAVEYAAEGRTTINDEWLPCAACGEPACVEHAKDYQAGFMHPECYESPWTDPGAYGH